MKGVEVWWWGIWLIVGGIALAVCWIAYGSYRRTGALICVELERAESLTVPELAIRLGMSDGLHARLVLFGALLPLVHSGTCVGDEPPDATRKDRVQRTRYRLVAR